MAIDFSFNDVSTFFNDKKEDVSDFFQGTTKKITDSFEENKEEFIDFKETLQKNAKELRALGSETKNLKVIEDFSKIGKLVGTKPNALEEKIATILIKQMTTIFKDVPIAIIEWLKANISAEKIETWLEKNISLEHTKAFFVSTAINGFGNILEEMIDGGAMIYGGVLHGFGKDTKKVEDFVQIDLTERDYNSLVDKGYLEQTAANSWAKDAGAAFGESFGTIMLQFLPGGNATLIASHFLKGVGSSGNKMLKDGKSFESALINGLGKGTIEGVSSFLLYGKNKELDKVADVIGKKLPFVKKITSLVDKLDPAKYGKVRSGLVKYAKSVIKPSLFTKFAVAGFKETPKAIIDEVTDGVDLRLKTKEDIAMNVDNLIRKTINSLTTTAINELVVAPIVNHFTNYKWRKETVEEAKNVKSESKAEYNSVKKEIKNFDKKSASLDNKDLRSDIPKEATAASTRTEEALRILEGKKELAKMTFKNAYADVKFGDRIVASEFVNKYFKKLNQLYFLNDGYNFFEGVIKKD